MSIIKHCVFCKKSPPDVKMSREHVLRARIGKVLPPCKKSHLIQKNFSSDVKSYKSRSLLIPESPYNWTVTDICKTCNEGWLHDDVEVPAEESLFSLIQGVEIEIPLATATALALWAAKTAAVRGIMDPKPMAISPEHFSWIKDNLAPPPYTYVWLARSEYTPDSFTRHLKFGIASNDGLELGHMSTIVIGHLAFFVLGCGSADSAIECSDTIRYLDNHPVFRIWPNSNATHFNKLPAFGREKIVDLSFTRLNIPYPAEFSYGQI